MKINCPRCGGSGEVVINFDPRDPASGEYIICSTCEGLGEVEADPISPEEEEMLPADPEAHEVPTERQVAYLERLHAEAAMLAIFGTPFVRYLGLGEIEFIGGAPIKFDILMPKAGA